MLMVLTSHNRLGNTGRPTGSWLEEFAASYFVFRDAGIELTLASPKGGQPPLDPKSDLPGNLFPSLTAVSLLARTLRRRPRQLRRF
jgi:putative intracellular protease/amidase